jgi:hypothetical protein
VTVLLLEPHNDDAVLFATATCLRERPWVATCLRSHRQGDNFARRELETYQAMTLLGCAWEQWEYPDSDPPWPEIRKRIEVMASEFDYCYAPWPRFNENGHDFTKLTPTDCGVCQHDRIGDFAREAFEGRFTGYLTYTRWGGKDENGVRVPFEPGWPLLKLKALAYYESQIERPEIVPHFLGSQTEFYAP